MKAGIFIPGLGEAFPGTTIKSYAGGQSCLKDIHTRLAQDKFLS